MMASPLANVLKKSLTITHQTVYEAWDWNKAAKDLQKEYADLVKLHEAISLEPEWQDLADRHSALTKEMQALENAKIGSSDEDRAKYTKKVAVLIKQAQLLKAAVENEPQKREDTKQAILTFQNRASKIAGLMKYMETYQLEKTPPFNELKQAKQWAEGNTTPNQMSRVVTLVDEAEKVVGELDTARDRETQRVEKERKAAEEKDRKLREEREGKEARSKKEQEAKRQSDLEDLARKQNIGPLLDKAIKAVADESKEYSELQKKIVKLEEKLTDKKYVAFSEGLEELKKSLKGLLRQTLLNKDYASFHADSGFEGLAEALQGIKDQKGGLSAKEEVTLDKDLNKLLTRMGNLAGDCTDYEDSLKLWDPTLIVARQQDPKVRGYVYTPELGVARTYLKDVVGILGKERRGRTSPNGNANHVHVLGDATLNAIFDWNGPGGAVRLLGFVVGHMDREASESVLTDAANVEAHANGGNFTLVEVDVIARTLVQV